jgi:peptidyl-prolyl cis-trans isomerase A (cyclophilin A)
MKAFFVLLAAGAVMLAQTPPPAKSAQPAPKTAAPAAPAANPLLHPETLKGRAPDTFKAKFTTTKGDFVVEVHRAWSPNGADRFYNLVKYKYFNNNHFFRIVPNFIVQFGMAADPHVNSAWDNATIKDDPVRPDIHNSKATMVFAKTGAPNSRTTQIFININDNNRILDSPIQQGFTPFGEVTEGMDIVLGLYSGYGDGPPDGHGPSQDRIGKEGKPYLDKNFPKLDSIKTAVIMPADAPATPAAATKSTAPAPAVKK